MTGAVALTKEDFPEPQAPARSRGEVLARYRHLRQVSVQINREITKLVSGDALRQQARRLGLLHGNTFVLDTMDELDLVFDLAVNTAPPDRSRAIDRYARSASFPPGSDEALMLDAMCRARFAIIVAERRHPAAGLIVTDFFRRSELWLVDEGLEATLPDGAAHATRYYTAEGFAMTAGVGMPVDRDFLRDVVRSVPQLARKPTVRAIDDRRFAEAVYREAIANGTMERVTYLNPGEIGDAL